MSGADRLIRINSRHHEPGGEWRQRAACRNVDPALFFPERGDNALDAKAICAGCPVREPCGEYGAHMRFGVWGGMAENDRRKDRRRRADLRAKAATEPARIINEIRAREEAS